MDMMVIKEKLLKNMALVIFFVFGLNSLALKFYWYSSVWWFDMPMHFLGGFWVALALIWLFMPKELSIRSIIKIILGVLLIGVLWEIFEIIVNNIFLKNPFNYLDTLSDICFDTAGGFTAIFYFFKRIMTV